MSSPALMMPVCPTCVAPAGAPCQGLEPGLFHKFRFAAALHLPTSGRPALLEPNKDAPAPERFQMSLPIRVRNGNEVLYGEACRWTTDPARADRVFRVAEVSLVAPRAGVLYLDRLHFERGALQTFDYGLVDAPDVREFARTFRFFFPTIDKSWTVTAEGNWTGALPDEWRPLRGRPARDLYVHLAGPALPPEKP